VNAAAELISRMWPLRFPTPGSAAGPAVVPVYPLTESLHADRLRDMIRQALTTSADQAMEIMPASLLVQHGYPSVKDALWQVHFPETVAQAKLEKIRSYNVDVILHGAESGLAEPVRPSKMSPSVTMRGARLGTSTPTAWRPA